LKDKKKRAVHGFSVTTDEKYKTFRIQSSVTKVDLNRTVSNAF